MIITLLYLEDEEVLFLLQYYVIKGTVLSII